MLAEPPFDTELAASDYHSSKIWNADKIYAWLKKAFVESGVIGETDARIQLLRQLADNYHLQCSCRYATFHKGVEARIGRSSAYSVLMQSQKEIRRILQIFGIGRNDSIFSNADDDSEGGRLLSDSEFN